jgi:protein SCO1/2
MTCSYSPRPRPLACLLMGALVVLGAGCTRQEAASSNIAAAPKPAVPGEVRHPLTGEVVDVSRERKALIVTHDEIKGYMPRMTMEFRVADGDLAIAKPGQRIRAELVERNGDYFLEKIWPDDAATKVAVDAAAKALAQDTSMRGRGVYREVGEKAPDFTLLDQEARAVSAHRFRGKHVVMNFIFTRCPIATMCPAATMKMMALQDAAKKSATELELVSISLDPEFDTPGVLKEYAAARAIDTANFTFLTGPDAAVRHLLAQLGVIREFEGETIKHTLATVLIDPTGRIIHRVDGSAWDAQEFLAKVKKP